MKHNRHKKQSILRKRLESSLVQGLSPLYAQGTFFDACVQKNANDKKLKIAKKRYHDLLDHAEDTIKQIKKVIEEMELQSAKEQKKLKLSDQDTKRNNKINGVPEDD